MRCLIIGCTGQDGHLLSNYLKNKQFYVSVEESGTYYVFKCLYNNNGAESTVQPSYGDTDPADPYFETNCPSQSALAPCCSNFQKAASLWYDSLTFDFWGSPIPLQPYRLQNWAPV